MRVPALIRIAAIAVFWLALLPSVRAEAPAQAVVAVGGEVVTPLRLDAAALQKLPRRAFDASEHGHAAHFEGVALADVLRVAGAPIGEALRGKNLALYVRVSASDGYRAVFALAELDPAVREGEVILADRRDGHALDAKEGPFRIVAKEDKRPARWVRQVVAIDLLAAPAP
jgi:DMSO/TMAO reductase YedYZ molybdopterin-dependent catalytic subunit